PGQPLHALPVPRRVEHLDVRAGRREDRGAGQRVDRGLQPQRRRRRPRRRLPPHARGHRLHAPRDRAGRRRPRRRDVRPARRHPQLPHPGAHEAEPPHRGLRAARLRLQLHRAHGQPAGRGHGHPPSQPGGRVLMRVMAQMSMVMNLDKCIGCHTCSVTCKQAWTNRDGIEYAWFNNVETRPGLGYPRTYQDQDKWKGGWKLTKRGKLTLRQGGRLKRLATIFNNPTLPGVSDYYEPWTYDYDNLLSAPLGRTSPVARPKSAITGKDMRITWSANWDDNLAGAPETGHQDPVVRKLKDELSHHIAFEYEKAFMFYLPRICEHCLNPSCVSACPSGAMYKRAEDGIVLVDQDACRGWRMCVTGCPYKKVFFNHATGKAEKCTMCYPRIEVGLPTVCSETCVGRLRYLGLVLYDAVRVAEAASVEDEHELLDAQRSVLLDPHDPEVIEAARRDGIPDDWIDAAQRSPVWRLLHDYE